MATERYTTVAGEVIEYPTPKPDVAAFLERVLRAAHDPQVSASHLVDYVYGVDNPLLRQGVLPGRGLVTKETFADPVYHVMLDLIDVKRVQEGTLNLERAADAYTMTVAEAAKEKGVTPGAIRQAIEAKRLDAMKKGGTHYLRPSSVASFVVSRRGPKPKDVSDERVAFAFRVGGEHGRKLQLLVVGGDSDGPVRPVHDGVPVTAGFVRRFERAAILEEKGASRRFFEIEPSVYDDAIEWGSLYVRGSFKVVRKVNNAKAARDAWKAFRGDDAATS